MVGTRPTLSPAARQRATRARRSATVRTTDRFSGIWVVPAWLGGEDMLRTGEAACAHILGIGLGGLRDLASQFGVALDEFRGEIAEQAYDVLGDQDLAVASRRRADADGRHRQIGGQLAGQR